MGLSWLPLPGPSLRARLSGASWISKTDNFAHLVLTPEGMRTEVPGGQFLPRPQDSLCSEFLSCRWAQDLPSLSDPIYWNEGGAGRDSKAPRPVLSPSSGALGVRVRMTRALSKEKQGRINLATPPGRHPRNPMPPSVPTALTLFMGHCLNGLLAGLLASSLHPSPELRLHTALFRTLWGSALLSPDSSLSPFLSVIQPLLWFSVRSACVCVSPCMEHPHMLNLRVLQDLALCHLLLEVPLLTSASTGLGEPLCCQRLRSCLWVHCFILGFFFCCFVFKNVFLRGHKKCIT